LNLTLYETGETSERVAFTCPGCGRDTVMHVGTRTTLDDKRCLNCRGTLRSGRAVVVQKGRIGTHQGRLTGDHAEQRRRTKRAASLRNAQRRAGYKMKNGETGRMPCRSYDECNHRKHRVADGHRN